MDDDRMVPPMDDVILTEITAEIVSAYVGHNAVAIGDVPKLISEVHGALLALSNGSQDAIEPALKPAVLVKKSITPDYLICLDDGRKFRTLKRHISGLGMTPDQYRTKWGLPADYPMVAPNYAAVRSQLAVTNGLGRKAAAARPKSKRAGKSS